jgi:hypothetical protein
MAHSQFDQFLQEATYSDHKRGSLRMKKCPAAAGYILASYPAAA